MLIVTVTFAYALSDTDWSKIENAQAAGASGADRIANASPKTGSASAIANDENGNFIVVWESSVGGRKAGNIFYRRFDAGGKALDSADVQVNSSGGEQKTPTVAMDKNGNFIIAWAGNGSNDADGIYAKAYDAGGNAIGGANAELAVNSAKPDNTSGIQSLPEVALNYNEKNADETFAIVWKGPGENAKNGGIFVQAYTVSYNQSAKAPKAGGQNMLITSLINNQTTPAIAMNSFGDVAVVWDSPEENGRTSQIWLQAYGKAGGKLSNNNPIKINSNSVMSASKPAIAADKSIDSDLGGNFIITYNGTSIDDSDGGIFLRRLKRCGQKSCILDTPESTVNNDANNIDFISGLQTNPQVSADYAGNFTIVWEDTANHDGSGNGIFAQSFKNDGTRLEEHFKVNGATQGGQQKPAIAMNADGFYVISYNDAPNQNIRFQQYSSDLYSNNSGDDLNPIASQEISGGGRRLSVPGDIDFPSVDVNTALSTVTEVALRDAKMVSPIQYVEAQDLDGTPFNITISTSDFTFTDGQKYLKAQNVAVKNCDMPTVDDVKCIETINGSSGDFSLNPATNDFSAFISANEQKTLANKTGHQLGKWRFFPKLQLTVPAITPPGDHKATITFSLQ